MSLRSIGLVGLVCLMALGCATNQPESASDARMWREEKERQQQGVREEGRIGYIGNEGSAGE
jgi:outer membrane biogenesis lipoprotein LolB